MRSIQNHPTSVKKLSDASRKRRIVSVIVLAANLPNPLSPRAIVRFAELLEELESIKATHTQRLRVN